MAWSYQHAGFKMKCNTVCCSAIDRRRYKSRRRFIPELCPKMIRDRSAKRRKGNSALWRQDASGDNRWSSSCNTITKVIPHKRRGVSGAARSIVTFHPETLERGRTRWSSRCCRSLSRRFAFVAEKHTESTAWGLVHHRHTHKRTLTHTHTHTQRDAHNRSYDTSELHET